MIKVTESRLATKEEVDSMQGCVFVPLNSVRLGKGSPKNTGGQTSTPYLAESRNAAIPVGESASGTSPKSDFYSEYVRMLSSKNKAAKKRYIAILEAEIKGNPQNAELWECLGNLLTTMALPDKALTAYEQAFSFLDTKSNSKPTIGYCMAQNLFELGRIREADKILSKALKSLQDWPLLELKGKIRAKQNKPTEAFQCYCNALQKAPEEKSILEEALKLANRHLEHDDWKRRILTLSRKRRSLLKAGAMSKVTGKTNQITHCTRCKNYGGLKDYPKRNLGDIEKEALARMVIADHFRTTEMELATVMGKKYLRTIRISIGATNIWGHIYFITCKDLFLSSMHKGESVAVRMPEYREFKETSHIINGGYAHAVEIVKAYIRGIE